MTTLDRYIARQFLFNVVALMVVLFSFVIMVDVALNIDRFLGRAEDLLRGTDPSSARKAVLTANLVVDIWWPRLLQLYNYTIGFGLLAAMGFTFTQLVRHREVVAVLAGGISLFRLLRPILIVAALMMGLKVINQEFVISNPRIAPLLARDPGDAGARELAEFPVPPTVDGRRQVFFAREFDPRSGVMKGMELWRRDERGVATSRISAAEAVWRVADGVGGWDLVGARITPLGMSTTASGGSAGSAAPAPSRIETDLEPATLLLNRFASFSQSLSWRQIDQMLTSGGSGDHSSAGAGLKPEMRAKLIRVQWGRVSTMISAILSLLITVPFFLLREPRNMLVQSLKCAPIGIIALMGGVLLAALPVPGLPPGFAVFLPVVVLLPITVAVLSTIRT